MRIQFRAASADGKAVKYTQQTKDGFLVESTYVDHGGKHIICFSSQVGCPIGCHFCASGQRKDQKRFRQSLSAKELISECENVIADQAQVSDGRPILFSCMGEGEPLLNLAAVSAALAELGESYPNSRGALSTSGIAPELIRELAHTRFPTPIKLQISLHAPADELRSVLIPTTAPLSEIISAALYYGDKTGNPVEWNYVLLRGVNDWPIHARMLARSLPRGAHIKLNRFNATAGLPFAAATEEDTLRFRAVLEAEGLIAEAYQTNGSDIGAACGQLTYKTNGVAPLRRISA
jgi:23S rRNA (adenine2503-C2)-methyltransferase